MRSPTSAVEIIEALLSEAQSRVGKGSVKDHLGFTTREYNDFFRKKGSLTNAQKIALQFNIPLDLNFSKNIDLQCAVEHFCGNKNEIPERYKEVAYSNKKIVLNILDSILVDHFDYIKRVHQLPENFFTDESGTISTLLTHDICETLSSLYYNDEQMHTMGHLSALKSSAFANSFKGESIVDSFEKLTDEVFLKMEKSHYYKVIKNNKEEVIIRKTYNEELERIVDKSLYKKSGVCRYIESFLGSIPCYSGGLSMTTHESKCMFRGNSHCEYHFYPKLRPDSHTLYLQ